MEAVTDVIGTCPSMCPTAELIMREREGLLHPFEVLSTEEESNTIKKRRPRADGKKIVKQFSRPAAGRADTEPSHLRPFPVLHDTVTYLFSSIVPKAHPAWSDVYEFVFDRLRAVRQDMVMQGIVGKDAISILEQVIRFHLYASYRLRDAVAADFDPVINKQHLLECLKRLLYLYKVTPGHHCHREEFEGIYLLDNLGDSHALLHCLGLPYDIRTSLLVRQCYGISAAFVLRDYSRAMKLISKLSCPMCLCAVNPHLYNLRINYLQILSAGYSVRNCKYPLEKLQGQLALTSTSSVSDLCSKCGLVDRFDHPDPNNSGYICFNKSLFKRPVDEEKPSTLAPLEALLDRVYASALLMGQTKEPMAGLQCSHEDKPSTGDGVVEINEIQSRLSNVGLARTADLGSTGEREVAPLGSTETSSQDSYKSVGRSVSGCPEFNDCDKQTYLITNSRNVIQQGQVKLVDCRPAVVYHSNHEGICQTPKLNAIHSNGEVNATRVKPMSSHRGRGVRLISQDESSLSTPRRGRGRGRRKV